MTNKKTYYPEVNPNPDFPEIEKGVLAFWEKEKLFGKSIENRKSAEEFIFYDGPPFANGLPHYGHLLTGYVKDLYARYQTMRGKKVERRFGWDCHGLPAEMGAEKELGISGRAAITNFGIGKFNDHCRTSVMKYTREWEDYVTRQARWVDFKNDYKTMDTNFMESVLWAFKQLYEKGLVYEAYRVMPYSWAAETPLSNFETKLDNSYREREDKAITVAFELNNTSARILDFAQSLQSAILETGEGVIEGLPSEETKKEYKEFIESIKQPIESYKIWAWTTTPWTLPSNLALAASADMSYLAIPVNGVVNLISYRAANSYKKELKLPSTFIFGETGGSLEEQHTEPTLKSYFLALKRKENNITIPKKFALKGTDLIGLNYHPLFPYFAGHKHAFKILDGSSFVTDADGTGIVHMAPGFGEDDQKVCEANGIEIVVPVDGQGKFTDEIYDIPFSSPLGGEQASASVSNARAVGGKGLTPHDSASASGLASSAPPQGGSLVLRGLNVIAEPGGSKFGLANDRIIDYLKKTGQLIKQEQIKHNYPHCWRTDQPLIYRAMPSWYVEVTKFRDRAVEINKTINWIPEHIRDGQMGHMLATAPDWSISRNRFWGTPIPVWRSKSGKIKVFGSIAELEKASGKKVNDLHRPAIDEIVITDGGEEFRRVEDVFDCWFESGSMPFAQVHYPFENKEWFEAHFPADFITEYVGQTRGWFNTLIMLSTALFDCAPFKNCICHGVVLDSETGLKYSKRLKNYRDPMEVMDKFGADALRWLMISSPVMRGMDLSVDPEGKFIRDVVRLAIKPIWNAYNFFTLYANADGIIASPVRGEAAERSEAEGVAPSRPLATLPPLGGGNNVMDRYILAKCAAAVETIEKSLDAYDTPAACDAVSQFFEALNNWYIRRNKERFWKEEKDADKQAAYDTLYTVLTAMCRAAAPLLPLTLDEIYKGLTGEKSVHLASYPALVAGSGADELMQQMDYVRDVCNAVLALRNKLNIRVRQPLKSLTIVSKKPFDAELSASIVKDEVNIKEYEISSAVDKVATLKLSLNNPVLGKRLPEKMKQIIPASKKGEWKQAGGTVEICGEKLLPGEYTLQLEPKPEFKDRAQALSTNDALVILDTTVTPELEAEGIARDLVRMIQQARKDAGLNVSDRIALSLEASEAVARAAKAHDGYIREQTLAATLAFGKPANAAFTAENTLDEHKVTIALSKCA